LAKRQRNKPVLAGGSRLYDNDPRSGPIPAGPG
jgi:hypothetical protein